MKPFSKIDCQFKAVILLFLFFLFNSEIAFAKSFKFVAISDSHLMYKNGTYYLYPATERIIKRIIEEIQPAFVIHCGDMLSITPDTENIETIWHMWNIFNRQVRNRFVSAGIPFFPSPGNHDVHGAGKAIYSKIWKGFSNKSMTLDEGDYSCCYAFHYENCFFISIDGSKITLSRDTLNWLDKKLEKYRKRYMHIFLITHVGLIGKARHPGDVIGGLLLKLLQEKGVDFVLSGHQHIYSADRLGSMIHFITGSAGETYPYFYMLFEVDENKVNWKVMKDRI